jgi:GDP-D-mannose dehydratase
MNYKSSASRMIALAMLHAPAAADVMDEYRDPSFTGGYVVGEYLFDETSEADQKAVAICGEYDVAKYATLYFRAQQAKIDNKIVDGQIPEKASDTDHISAAGTRLR